MSTANEFSEYYKTISDAELLEIIDNPSGYQPSALEAAQKELSDRQLSEPELEHARQLKTAKQEAREKNIPMIISIESRIKSKGSVFIGSLNPMQPGIPSAEKAIRILVCVFGGLFLYDCIKEHRLFFYTMLEISTFPIYSLMTLFPQLLLGVAVFLFWKRKMIGWALLTAFTTMITVTIVLMLVQYSTLFASGLRSIDRLFPMPSLESYLIQLIIFGSALIVLCRERIRIIYAVDKAKMIAVIIIGALLSICARIIPL